MRDHARVSPKFWVGETGKAIRAEGADAQIIAMYLLTSPHSNMLGLYYLPLPFISHETGIPLEGALKALRSLERVGFAGYDEASEHVWVYEMARFQVGESLKENDNRVKNIRESYESLPNNLFLGDFFDKYSDAFHLEIRREPDTKGRGLKGPSKPLRSQEKEKEQEKEQDKDTSPSLRSGESSSASAADPPTRKQGNGKTPPCPHEQIIAAYHEELPELRPVQVWNDTRRKFLQGRWRENPGMQSVDSWREYFRFVRESEFLMGQADPGPGKKPFSADLEWLVRPQNYAKVVEGKYHDAG